ncbi:MAG: NAD-dependent epimerase/dehydratase family protein [Propionibacteriaceae bacterium]|jgi:nucleoside-diphosphate-sugar epimerase|nr:NAD-dependent epimerase/dehydratase family protein [Propionibacteriaceae bacterium]
MESTVLFIGGTGIISSACAREALELGFRVTVLNRGRTALRPAPDGVEVLHADLDDDASLASALAGRQFDVVADFMTFTPAQLARNLDLVTGRIGQYILTSSASAYAKPVASLPIRESTPLRNPYWQYSRDKIACEELLIARFRDEGLPATIVRPCHTYDQFHNPIEGGWTQIARMRAGKPAIVHGDGTSLWTITHASDFAYSYAGLLARPAAFGETYHITGDEVLTWDAIYTALATAAGVASPELVHVSSETIARFIPEWGPGLVGDKAHCAVFDNSKVRALRPGFAQKVPFSAGARQIIAGFDAHPELQKLDPRIDAKLDELVAFARGLTARPR